ncbi:MAG: long-chain fatty acid--CoA ligase [Sphingomonadales bacterium]|nr:long-chain fatty acid--CoA ligase [Sphingomonadales bacterium]
MNNPQPDLAKLLQPMFGNAPDRPAIRHNDIWYDWGWVQAVMRGVTEALNEAGIPTDRPVAVIARNRPSSGANLLALLAAGRSISMIYALQSAGGMAADLRAIRPAALIADVQDWNDELLAAAREVGCLGLKLEDQAAAVVTIVTPRDPARAASHHEPFAVPGIELLTSGTPGKPKRQLISATLIARAMILESTIYRNADSRGTELPHPMILPFPFGNISGLYTFLPMAVAAIPILMLEKFDIDVWIDCVKKYRPKSMSLPPAGMHQLLERNLPKEDLASLAFLASGATRIDPAQIDQILERYGLPILSSYGATEFGGPVTNMTYEMHQQFGSAKRFSVGRPWAGAELRVVDEDDFTPLPAGKAGLLEVMAPRIGTHWIRTTDLGLIDEDGFIYILGRADGAISRGGFKIVPDVVVDALLLHPAVGQAAVVGLPDPRLGQIPVAAVVLKAGASVSEEELKAHARAQLYTTHVPARFKIVDALPLTVSLKVSLPAVAALFDAV